MRVNSLLILNIIDFESRSASWFDRGRVWFGIIFLPASYKFRKLILLCSSCKLKSWMVFVGCQIDASPTFWRVNFIAGSMWGGWAASHGRHSRAFACILSIFGIESDESIFWESFWDWIDIQ
jgi:hypothetical protein